MPDDTQDQDQDRDQGKGQDQNAPSMEQVVAAIQYLGQQMQAIKASVAAVQEQAKPAAPDKPDNSNKDLEDVDVEALSRAEFARYIVNQVQEKLVGPIHERIGSDEEEIQRRQARQEVARLEKEHEDFWDWQDEIAEVLRKHPTLEIEEAYRLARTTHPDKAERIDKAAADKSRADAEEEPEDQTPDFGGLLPTSGKVSKNTNMSAKEAAEAAWEELGMSNHLRAVSQE